MIITMITGHEYKWGIFWEAISAKGGGRAEW
jgi:hypothetical protein